MTWFVVVLVVVGIGVLVRIVFKLRALRSKPQDDWDFKIIERLRAQGSDPFKPHEADFFFALPNDAAVRAINALLEAEGYTVNIKAVPENVDHPFSLHARKSMRLSVPDMRELSHRFTALAVAQGGRYDGWAADVVR